MQKAIQILEDNFRLNSDDYIKLLGMLQELQQYRNNTDKIIISQEEMEYIQRLEKTAQLVVSGWNMNPNISNQVSVLEDVLKEGYE